MKKTHTKTPWDWGYKNDKYSTNELLIIKPDGDFSQVICGAFMTGKDSEKEANAKFIVKACNSYDVMTEALKLAREALGDLKSYLPKDVMYYEHDPLAKCERAIKAIDKSLGVKK